MNLGHGQVFRLYGIQETMFYGDDLTRLDLDAVRETTVLGCEVESSRRACTLKQESVLVELESLTVMWNGWKDQDSLLPRNISRYSTIELGMILSWLINIYRFSDDCFSSCSLNKTHMSENHLIIKFRSYN